MDWNSVNEKRKHMLCSHTYKLTMQTQTVVKGTVFTVKTLKQFETITMYTTQRTTVVDVDIASRQTLNWPVTLQS